MKRFILLFSLIFIIVIIISIIFSFDNKIKIQLVKCIDGDTAWFLIDGKKEKVRFLGIDTPESVHPNGVVEDYGKAASEYTCNLLTNASSIYLEYDINSDRYDKYDRVLGWIFVDNNNLSELLLSKGLAEVNYVYGNYKYLDNLCNAQMLAYKNNIGIWNSNNSYQDNYCNIEK